MEKEKWLADQFEAHRDHLQRVAYRMLGSTGEADDAVQEAWLRLSRSDTHDIQNLTGWLTTVVAHICLDMLRSHSRREESLETRLPETLGQPATELDPEQEVLLADSIGLALLVVLETLAPAERVAFVLHDMFAVPFDEIGPIVGRSPTGARQLASRARRRVQATDAAPDAARSPQRKIVDAFLTAARGGDFGALLALLDPNVVMRSDDAAVRMASTASVRMGSMAETRGAQAVAQTFAGGARAARLALIDGIPGLIWSVAGEPRAVFRFTLAGEKIVAIDLVADPAHIASMELTLLHG
jgi:RNA polymerase sigma-70 factor (ECF subfamily)